MSEMEQGNPDEIYANEPRAALAKRHRRLRIGGVIVLIATIVGIQLLPAGVRRDNPPVVQEPPWDSPETRALAVRACFDCHSNETTWPWYSYIAPMSWMILQDVHKGREVLNFSTWGDPMAQSEAEEAVELVSKQLMPLPYFVILHPEAELSDAERGQLINGLIATMTQGRANNLQTDNLDEED
ncbi:MAG: heme-binding domain-containing protein [Caldilineaceae bacterium]|nr:heme-binding domain-containing protein [Caldilineaceae bacterium]HRW05745.1 heme-binding domain-containing protein [Caldilineaceae bacterium]